MKMIYLTHLNQITTTFTCRKQIINELSVYIYNKANLPQKLVYLLKRLICNS